LTTKHDKIPEKNPEFRKNGQKFQNSEFSIGSELQSQAMPAFCRCSSRTVRRYLTFIRLGSLAY